MKTRALRQAKLFQQKPGLLDIVESWYSGSVLRALLKVGAFEKLCRFTSPQELAARCRWRYAETVAVLEFLFQRSDVLERSTTGKYRLALPYQGTGTTPFRMIKFIGAYGGLFEDLNQTLGRPQGRKGIQVNENLLAQAFSKLDSSRPLRLPRSLLRLSISNLAELGCGTAPVLRSLCHRRKAFRGWAVDPSLPMCEAARVRARRSGCLTRIKVMRLSVEAVINGHGYRQLRNADALCLRGVLNAYFSEGERACVEILKGLAARFPGRTLIVMDYYGKLTRCQKIDSHFRHTLVHDAVQSLSGQGIPPARLTDWRRIYFAAGVVLTDYGDIPLDGVEAFVHIVRLGRDGKFGRFGGEATNDAG